MEMEAVKMKNKTALKNMEYTRYIGVRYALALFLFTNLNWSIALFLSKSFLIILPLLLVLYTAFAALEQIKLYSKKDYPLKHTKNYFTSQAFVNLFLSLTFFSSALYDKAFPFMASSTQGKVGTAALIGIGLIISVLSIKKINKIEQKKDRLFKEVSKYKKSMKVSEKNGK